MANLRLPEPEISCCNPINVDSSTSMHTLFMTQYVAKVNVVSVSGVGTSKWLGR